MDRPTRTRTTPFSVVQNTLGQYWKQAFTTSMGKWTEDNSIAAVEGASEGACDCTVTARGKSYTGSFDNVNHAEINALFAAGWNGVTRIKLSSAPCPRCAVILELRGLSDKVRYRPSSSRLGPSWGWPGDTNALVSLLTQNGQLAQLSEQGQREMITYFIGGTWMQ